MAIQDSQKIDYLWKKLGYGAAKTDTNSNKLAPNEAIASPLILRGDKVWQQAEDIPTVMPSENGDVVDVYLTSAPDECTNDGSATANRTWLTGLTDWIPPEIGSTYQVKVYIHTAGDAAGASGGDQVFATGSGNDDEWFFDYQAGVLHFIGDNLPDGVNFSGKSVYISGARYTGTFGVGGDGDDQRFGNLHVDDTTVTSIPSTANHFIDAEEGLFVIQGTAGIVIPTGTTAERRDPATDGTLRYNTDLTQLEIYDDNAWHSFEIDTEITNQTLAGDGSTTVFTLDSVATANTIFLTINGVMQTPVTDYSVDQDELTMSEAPSADDVIQVRKFVESTNVIGMTNSNGTASMTPKESGVVSVIGSVTEFTGNITATGFTTVDGDFEAGNISTAGTITGDIVGNITGDITGNLTGDVTGDLTGDVTGDVTGDLVGDVTAGDITASGTASVTGNITAGNISSAGTITKAGVEVATVNDISTLNATLVDNTNDIIELEEEIEALAPSFDRGNWEHDTSTGSAGATPGTGEYYIADGSNNITQNFGDTAKIYFDNTDSQTPALTHTFDDVVVDMYVELFESGDSSFLLGTVTAITQNTGYTVFDVTVVKAEGGPSLTGGVRVKFFELSDASVDLDGYLQTSGGTLTGLLTMNKAGGTALTVQNSGTTTLTVLNDGTITTTKTTFSNDHLVTKSYVDDNTVSKIDNNTITTTTNIYQGTSADRFHQIKSYAPLDGGGSIDTSTAWGLEVDLDHQNSGKNTFKVTTRLGDVFRITGGTGPTLNTGYPFKTTRSSFTEDTEFVPKSYVDTAITNVDTSSLGLATVATTGSYNDLSNKPSIPSSTTNYVKTDSTGFSNNLTITKSGSKYYISGG